MSSTIHVQPQLPPATAASSSSSSSSASSSNDNSALTSYLASLPPLPAFVGTADVSHTDELLFEPRERSKLNAAATSSDTGYEFQFVDQPVDQDLVCVVCTLVCKDAVETSCSHIFCQSCLQTWLLRHPTCISCRASLTSRDVHASGFVRRKVLSLRVRCTNHSYCQWTGEMRYLSQHIRKDCELQKMIHAMEVFVEAKPDAHRRISAPGEEEEKEDEDISADRYAAVHSTFPPAILNLLSPSALHRLASYHTFHPLSSEEVSLPFYLAFSSSALMAHRHEEKPQQQPSKFLYGRLHQCGGECVKPPIWMEEEGQPAAASSSSSNILDYLYSTLTLCRRQHSSLYLQLSSYFHSLPIRTLHAFLLSKGVPENSYAQRGIEKNELVELCMENRNKKDMDEYRKANSGHAAGAAAAANGRFSSSSSASAANGDESCHDFTASILHQIQTALNANIRVSSSNPRDFHNMMHNAMHQAQHRAMSQGHAQQSYSQQHQQPHRQPVTMNYASSSGAVVVTISEEDSNGSNRAPSQPAAASSSSSRASAESHPFAAPAAAPASSATYRSFGQREPQTYAHTNVGSSSIRPSPTDSSSDSSKAKCCTIM